MDVNGEKYLVIESDEESTQSERANARAPGLRQRRLERIREFEEEALEREDGLLATMAAVAADLSSVAADIGDALKNELASQPATVERVRQLTGTMSLLLQYSRQIRSFAELELRVEQAQQKRSDLKRETQRGALNNEWRDATHRRAGLVSRKYSAQG